LITTFVFLNRSKKKHYQLAKIILYAILSQFFPVSRGSFFLVLFFKITMAVKKLFYYLRSILFIAGSLIKSLTPLI
jgi:hypothetical protein